jgi:hypothetical protein
MVGSGLKGEQTEKKQKQARSVRKFSDKLAALTCEASKMAV